MPTGAGFMPGDLMSAVVALTGGSKEVRSLPTAIGRTAVGEWVAGDAALTAPYPYITVGTDRVYDPISIPVLLGTAASSLAAYAAEEEIAWGACIPARWGVDRGRAISLSAQLRASGVIQADLKITTNLEAIAYAARLTDGGAINSALKGVDRLQILDLAGDCTEFGTVQKTKQDAAESIPMGLCHGLQQLRQQLPARIGPIPFSALLRSLQGDDAADPWVPTEAHMALMDALPAAWETIIAAWWAALVFHLDTRINPEIPLIISGEALAIPAIHALVSAQYPDAVILDWYGAALGLARVQVRQLRLAARAS